MAADVTGSMVAATVRVRPGSDLVVRYGDLVAVVRAPDEAVPAILDALVAASLDRSRATDLIRESRRLPGGVAIAVALLGPEIDVVVIGGVRCDATGVDSDASFSGSSAAQLLGLPAGVTTVSLAFEGSSAEAHVRTGLVDGVVLGSGVEIVLGAVDATRATPAVDASAAAPAAVSPAAAAPAPAAPAAPPMPATLPPPPPPVNAPDPVIEPVVAAGPIVNLLAEPLTEDERPEPLPEVAAPVAEPEVVDRRRSVTGLACSIGHINRLEADYCSSCGRRLQGTINLKEGQRPSLGTLIFDDGTTFGLEFGYVIGREPETDPAIRDGGAHPLVVTDAERSVSRVHAEVRLDGWNTMVLDRGSANGTYVAAPDGSGWNRLEPNVPTLLPDGWSVAVGRRTFVFQQR
jgi:hypothetical protein